MTINLSHRCALGSYEYRLLVGVQIEGAATVVAENRLDHRGTEPAAGGPNGRSIERPFGLTMRVTICLARGR